MSQYRVLAGLLIVYLAGPLGLASEVYLGYAQTPTAWGVVSEVKRARGDVPRISGLVGDHFGTFELAWTRLGVLLPLGQSGWDLGVEAQGAAYGRVDNPVVPELQGRLSYGGLIRGGYRFRFEEIPSTHFCLGVWGGQAYEKRAYAFSTDLLDRVPVSSGNLSMVGLEGKVSFTSRSNFLREPLLFLAKAEGRYSSFDSTIQENWDSLLAPLSDSTFRYLLSLDSTWKPRSFGTLGLGFHGFLGPQPLPIPFMPVLWDRVLPPSLESEWRTLVGLGGHVTIDASKRVQLRTGLGFYGGYFGL